MIYFFLRLLVYIKRTGKVRSKKSDAFYSRKNKKTYLQNIRYVKSKERSEANSVG